MPMGLKWANGLVFGINSEECVVEDEDGNLNNGTVIQVFLGFFIFYIILEG